MEVDVNVDVEGFVRRSFADSYQPTKPGRADNGSGSRHTEGILAGAGGIVIGHWVTGGGGDL